MTQTAMGGDKVLVFDLNGVFIYKKEDLKVIPGLQRETLVRVRGRFLSPLVNVLKPYFQQHPCKIVIWSTMVRKNMLTYVRSVEQGLQTTVSAVFSQEDCDEGPWYEGLRALKYKKDLRKVAEKMNVKVDDCVLIDDSAEKRVDTQNFYKYDSHDINSYETLVNFIDSFLNANAL